MEVTGSSPVGCMSACSSAEEQWPSKPLVAGSNPARRVFLILHSEFQLKLHTFIRCALGLHGILHVAETVLNLYEGAYYSAVLSLLSSVIMVLGAFLGHRPESANESL